MADLNVKILLQLIDKVSGPAKKVQDGLGGVAKQGRRATKSFQLAASLNQAAEGVARLADQAKQLLIKPVVEFADFEKKVAEVGTLIDDSFATNEQLAKIAEDTAAVFGGKAVDQAAALYDVISAGAKDASIATEVLAVANELAIAGVTDTKTAVDGLTSVLNAFQRPMSEATDFSDKFFVAVQKGKTTVPELANSIGKLAPLAKGLGLDMSQTAGAIAALTSQGIKTSEAVSGLKAAFANILTPSEKARKEAKRLKIQFNAAALGAKGLDGFLSDVTASSGLNVKQMRKMQKASGGNVEEFERLLKASGANVDSLGKLFGSVEAINAVMALTSGEGKGFTSTLKAMDNSLGVVKEGADEMRKTQAFAFEQVRAQIDQTVRTLGEGFAPALNDALQDVTAVAKAVKEFADAHPEAVREVGSLLIKLIAFGAVLRTTLLLASTFSGAKGLLGIVRPLARVATGAKKGTGTLKALSGMIKLTAGGLAGAAGLVLLAAAAGVALGTMLDKALGLSDALAGIDKEINKAGGRGGAARLGSFTEEELAERVRLQEELKKAEEDFASGITELDRSRAEERAVAAKAGLGDLNREVREREKVNDEITQLEAEERQLEQRAQAPEALEPFAVQPFRGAEAEGARAKLEIEISEDRPARARVVQADNTDVSVDSGVRELGT